MSTVYSNSKNQTMHTTELQIATIRVDGGTQSRVELDMELVNEYSKLMHSSIIFPPIDVCFDGKEYWLIDGFHRLKAAIDLGLEIIKAELYEGSQRDAQLISFGVNSSHGKRRTNADKRKAVMSMLADSEWSQWASREIAKACNVSHTFVDRLRSETLSGNVARYEKPAERKVTRNGTTYKQDTAKIGRRDEQKTEYEILDAEPREKQEKKLTIQEQATRVIEGEAPAEVMGYDPTSEPELTDQEIEEFQAEHEARLSEYLELAKSEDALGKALTTIDELSQKVAKLEQSNVYLERQLEFRTNELNIFKRRLAAINKAAAKKEAK